MLHVYTAADDFVFGSGDSSLSFTLAVPEPGTGVLLGGALLGIVLQDRRRGRSPSR